METQKLKKVPMGTHLATVQYPKHCKRHNGPRLLSLKLELSLQLKQIRIPASALLTFLHSLVTTILTLCTSLTPEVGLSIPQVVKKYSKKSPKKVILLKSTGESTKKCTKKVLKLKRTKKSTL